MTTTKKTIQGFKTGRDVTYHGVTLPEVHVAGGVSYPDVVEVDGVSYYVHDFGGVFAGSQEVCGIDFGGNNLNGTRTAPQSRMGIARKAGVIPARAQYSEVEIFFDN